MLEQIRIKDLAIIDDLTVEFGKGLNILTGETGAGKSIIIGALNLILGERASTDDIRSGCDNAEVEALFSVDSPNVKKILDTLEIPIENNEIIIRRIINSSSKGKILVNNILVPLSSLKEIGDNLVDIHGQHQHQSLLSQENHIDVLDAFSPDPQLLKGYAELYYEYTDLKQKYNKIIRDDREVEKKKSILEYQINEIVAAKLKEGEDEELQIERERLLHAEKLRSFSSEAYGLLEEEGSGELAILKRLSAVKKNLDDIADIDSSASTSAQEIDGLIYQLQDISTFLDNYSQSVQVNPHRLEEVQQRVDLINSLKKKYGGTIEEILDECKKFKEEYKQLEHQDEEINQLEALLKEKKIILSERAIKLSDNRRKIAEKLEKAIIDQLKQLNMPDVNFKVDITHLKSNEESGIKYKDEYIQFNEKGIDNIEFLISPNIGESLKPLKKIASGGELSRIMLALKTIIAAKDKIPVLVFDEIDVGISGATGDKVGNKLKDLGQYHQIICITHLAQIAAKADLHYAVSKSTVLGRTLTKVTNLDFDQRVSEIARLIEGDPNSQTGRQYARKIIESKAK